MTSFVIDTNIFCCAQCYKESPLEHDPELILSSMAVLEEIKCSHSISVDNKGEIFSKYKEKKIMREYSDGHRFLEIFWKHMIKEEGKIMHIEPFIEEQHKEQLLYLGFKRNDMIFVEVANNTADKTIITIDSDFGIELKNQRKHPRIKRFLETKLNVQALTPIDAKQILLNQ